jgi:hypothetical protein
MGRAFAQELAETVIDIHKSIAMHLSSNFYPPVPATMVQPCVDAIYAAEDENWDLLIELPAGVTWKGETSAPVHRIIQQHHLEPWLGEEEWEEEVND